MEEISSYLTSRQAVHNSPWFQSNNDQIFLLGGYLSCSAKYVF